MSKFKVPIILLIVVLGLYIFSLGVKINDENMSIDRLKAAFERFVNKPIISAGALSLLQSKAAGCRLSASGGVPVIFIQKNGLCSVIISSSDENVRTLPLNSSSAVVFDFIGEKGSEGQPASAPFEAQSPSDLSNSLDVMSGGGMLTIKCNDNQQQCKVSFG